MPRWIITLLLVAAAAFLAWALANSRPRPAEEPPAAVAPVESSAAQGPPASPSGAAPESGAPGAPAAVAQDIEGLHIVQVGTQPEPVIGDAALSKDNPFPAQVKLTPWGAGMIDVSLSRYSAEVVLREEQFEAYPVQQRLVDRFVDGRPIYRYPLAAQAVFVNGQPFSLADQRWELVASDRTSATFVIRLADGQGAQVLRIRRTWRLEQRPEAKARDRHALYLDQQIENVSGAALSVRFAQFGPMDLPKEAGYIGDQRHVILGYLQPRRASEHRYITTDDFDLPRATVIDGPERLWPAAEGADERRELLWAAMTNRYFTAAVHAPLHQAGQEVQVRPLSSIFPVVRRERWGPGKADSQSLALVFDSGESVLAAGAVRPLHLNVYLGPKSPEILNSDAGYEALGLGQVVVYNLGGCCAVCTFAWLANGLFAFMGFIHMLVRDWGIAIIVLVAIVRAILHPLTKGAQVNMMKLSKQMQTLQPELEKLKAKYKDNTTKLNQEMMALYREKGVNPASMGLGCLPMFLQMPIWIALYAMLYFAIELRHESAFWGFFQWISGGHWPFLADLSSEDRFIPLPAAMQVTIPLIGQKLTAINILPILMGVVFYIQQKYMAAPSPNMSPEMKQQQAMMKWMMVILFPLMLFWAPSGLTLYILTSTAVGIVESKRVRAHIKELEDSGRLHEKKQRKPGGFMDRLMKAAEARQKMIEDQAKAQQRSGKKKNR